MSVAERPFRMALGVLVAAAMLALAGCGQTSAPSADFTPRATPGGFPNEVDLSATAFLRQRLTINAGDTVTFVDRADGGPHILCLGQNGHCDGTLTGPADLAGNGFRIDANQTKFITFAEAGTYRITCPIYPAMNLTITVKPK